MNLSAIKNFVTSKAGAQLLSVQKNSPVLLLGAGVIGVGATVFLACRATLKVEGILADHREDLKDLENLEDVNFSDQDRMNAKVYIYLKTSSNLIKIYSPAVAIGLASVSFLASSHVVMARRNAGLMAAYTALEKGFNKYRSRVLNDVGADKDREYRYGVEDREIVEEKADGKTVTKKVKSAEDTTVGSVYAKVFSQDSSREWSPDPGYNLMFLKCQQNWLNDKLKAKGHVFLNEAYDALGLDRTPEGQIVGWVFGGSGDDYVDLGIFDRAMQPQQLEFFTGRNDAILLDFNVDGPVWREI